MAAELLEVKFRLYDGTDIGPSKYALTTKIANLKESVFSQWPGEKEVKPTTVNDLMLINAGKILENNKTLAESRVPAGEITGGVVTMHVVVQQSTADTVHSRGALLMCGAAHLACYLGHSGGHDQVAKRQGELGWWLV